MTVPDTLTGGIDTIAVIALLIEFFMLRTALLRTQVRLYAAQSLLVTAATVMMAAGENVPDLYALAGVSFIIKVIAVPAVVLWLVRRRGLEIAGSSLVKVASAVLIGVVAAGFGFFAVSAVAGTLAPAPPVAVGVSGSMVLVGFVVMILRRDVISQAIGFFTLENGISMASLFLAAGLNIAWEIVALVDVLVGAVALGLIIRMHRRQSNTLSTNDFDRLRG